ncbi:MAG: sensor domain-containing diguanylate cyclase [Gammaproteobacteria bacterium]|nr:sensor domain-containing diguanylate cyclase [Gammaproteobacteria bacterium]
MTDKSINESHWMMGMLDSINVGLVVVDLEYRIQMWNDYMENLSGSPASKVLNKVIYELFAEIPEAWFKNKINSVSTLGNHSFTIWEQNPYLFKFKNYRPITGAVEYMYQNTTFIPLSSPSGEINQVGIIIYDVTDAAINKLELETSNNELKKLSRTDRLTQLNNRGYWEECLYNEYMRVKRTNQPASLIIFDIDHFKKVNDTYGHMAGDEVIRQTAAALRESIRDTDIPGRYGGEEFVLILIDTKPESAFILAERIRKKIEGLTVIYEDMEIKYTISLGISQAITDSGDYMKWLECADNALYTSKESGRNQTTIYSPKSAE